MMDETITILTDIGLKKEIVKHGFDDTVYIEKYRDNNDKVRKEIMLRCIDNCKTREMDYDEREVLITQIYKEDGKAIASILEYVDNITAKETVFGVCKIVYDYTNCRKNGEVVETTYKEDGKTIKSIVKRVFGEVVKETIYN